jgi:hypothetical protein
VPKVHNKPIKRPRKGFKQESKRQPERLPGRAHRTVQCNRALEAELFTFGNFHGHSAIIHRTVSGAHRTVRCASGATATSRSNGRLQRIKCVPTRAEDRAAPEGAPDSLQDLSGAPPDSPEAPQVRAPMVEPQRLADVAGAPDCPVRHATAHF